MKTELMNQMSILLQMVKPHLIKCEYVKPDLEYDDAYVIVTCENGHQYKIDVTANSDIAIVNDVFSKMTHK